MSVYTLPFLEGRSYMHGSTLYDKLYELFQPKAKHTFKIIKPIFSNCVQIVFSNTGKVFTSKNALLAWSISSKESYEVFVIEQPTIAPIQYEYFDEKQISQAAYFSHQAVTIEGIPEGETYIRVVIALNKALLTKEVHQSTTGQWVFVRIDSFKIPYHTDSIRLELVESYNKSIIATKIMHMSEQIGIVYFYWSPYKIKKELY